MQYPFSRFPFFAEQDAFKAFQKAVNTVLPVLAEATKQERNLSGNKTGTSNTVATKPLSGLKRKREDESAVTSQKAQSAAMNGKKDDLAYTFIKYLTSPELLELEISDVTFRRQILFQLLITLQQLKTYTAAEKAKWQHPKNKSLWIDFTLGPPLPPAEGAAPAPNTNVGNGGDEESLTWVLEIDRRVMLELRLTQPDGRGFEEMVGTLLERDKNWVCYHELKLEIS